MKHIDPLLPSAQWIELDKYKKDRTEYEKSHVILLGDSDEAKLMYKTAKNGRWDYYNLGMRFMSYGNKTVLLVRRLQNEQISDLLWLARKIGKEHTIKIPKGAKTVTYTAAKQFLEDKIGDSKNIAKNIFTVIINSPQLAFEQTVEQYKNGIQSIKNLLSHEELEFLQYCVAIYEYLKSENALV